MSGGVLEKIFQEGILPSESCYPRKKEYIRIMQQCEKQEEAILAKLGPEIQDMLITYKDILQTLTSMENEECYIQGLSLGIRLASEAFILGKCGTE